MSITIRFAVEKSGFTLDAECEVPSKGVTAFFGPSGSGKTTLLRLIAGLERADKGRLHIDGVAWEDRDRGVFLPPHQRAVGYVFQEAALFPHRNVRGNLDFGYRRIPAKERRLNYNDVVQWCGIESLLDRNVRSLSGGERQRVAIARALLVSPRLLLMDEPLASLDDKSKRELLPYFEELFSHLAIPVLYVSHSIEEVARLASHMVLFLQGHTVATGPVNDLLTRLDLAPAERPDATAVVEARVAGHETEYHLTELEFDGGRLLLPWEKLEIGDRVRVAIHARDVSITLDKPEQTSILNVLPAEVIEIAPYNDGQSTLRLRAGTATLLSRITRKSAERLGLTPGSQVFAQVKSASLTGR